MNRYSKNSSRQILRIACCLLGLMAAILMAPRVVAQQPAFLTNGLVAYYPFNGNANDESGKNWNGLVGRTTIVSDRFGRTNAAYYSDEVGSGVDIPLKMVGIYSSSFSFWFKTTSGGVLLGSKGLGPHLKLVVGSENSTGPGTTGVVYFGLQGRGFDNISVIQQTKNKGSADGYWHHVVGVMKSEGGVFSSSIFSIFIDGKIVNGNSLSDINPIALPFEVFNISIASDLTWSTALQTGPAISKISFDDVRIYNRALSDTEVKALYDYESTPPDNNFITNGLVAYYPFNGNANDESGSGNNGAVQGALLSPDRNGNSNKAYNFDGKSQIVVPSSSSLNLTSFSVSAWVKIQNPDRTFYEILTKGGDLDENYEILVYGNQSPPFGTIDTAVKWSDGTRGGWSGESPSKNYVKPLLWNHILVSYDQTSGFLNVYINREISFRAFVNKTPKINSTPLHIGSDPNMGRNHLGSIDDVRIYNRALSDTEVKALYDYESTPPVTGAVPDGMALIPAGPFQMGDERVLGATPVHTVTVSAFAMDKWEMSVELWESVRVWGNTHGYDLVAGGSFGAKHPVRSVNWYDVVKWCNARSEKEEKVPAYYVDAAMTQVYRSGEKAPAGVKWDSGYRLPTEAEWEKAARGGVAGKLYPWGADEISPALANYSRNESGTMPVGSYGANGYGLYDIAGNVWEWIWDWYGDYSSTAQIDPRGPSSGSSRVFRGGSRYDDPLSCLVAFRPNLYSPGDRYDSFGFRSVLPSVQTDTVLVPVSLTQQPQSVVGIEGETVQLSVTATGSPTPTYQWFKDGDAVPGGTNAALTLANVRPAMIGDYTAVVSNASGSVTSSVATLSIKGMDSGIWKGLVAYYPFNGNANDESGKGNNFDSVGSVFGADRFNQPNRAYGFSGALAKKTISKFIPGAGQSKTIAFWIFQQATKFSDAFDERIISFGDGIVNFRVRHDPPWNSESLPDLLTVDIPSSSGRFIDTRGNFFGKWTHCVYVFESDGFVRSYLNGINSAWFYDSNPEDKLIGISQSALVLGAPWIGFNGFLDQVRIYDRALSNDQVSAIYQAERVPDTVISSQPQGSTAIQGSDVALSVVALNPSPLVTLNYQWQKDGNPIPGATNSLLTVTNVQPVNIGDYNVIVSGGFQAVTSAAAALSMEGVNSGIWKGLVAWYEFSGNLDETTQALGSDGRGILFGADRFGAANGAGVFKRADRSQFKSSGTLLPIGNSSRTLSVWYRGSGIQGAGAGSMLGYGSRAPADNFGEWLLTLNGPSDGLPGWGDLSMGEGLVGGKTVGKWKSGPAAFMDDRWHNLVVRYNGANLDFFLDNKALAWGAGAFTPPLNTKATDLTVGSTYWDDWFFAGSMDDIRIYNRSLSDSDIKSLYEFERVPDTVITRQPQSAAVAVGGSVRLEVEASNPVPTVLIVYQWFKDGAKLVGATNPTLNLGQLRPEQIGSYTVTVDDGSRTLTSTAANVSLQGVDSSIWKGLIASYPLDGNFDDSTGFGDSLIPFGPVNFVDQGRRTDTKAARVSGGDGFLVGSDHAWFSGSEPRTISVWIKPEATSTNVSTVLLLGSLENCGQRFSLQVPAAQNGIRFDGGDCAADIRSKTFTGSSLSGKWTHAVLTYDGTSVRCYVNSLASGSAYAVGLNTDSTAPLVLGNAVGLDGEGFTGLIDDVRIYNRSLSAVEVRSLYLYESSGVAPSLPQITRQPTPLSGYEGETLKLSVEASGYQLGYQWQRGGQNLASDLRLLGINSSELQIKGARLDDGGDYRVLVTNSFGAVTSSTVKLTVAPPVRSLVAGLANEVQEGQRMTFPISMVSTGDVGGLTFKLTYNAAFLTDPKVEWSAVVGQSVNSVNTTTAGEVSGAFSLAGTALAAGTVPVGTVNFRARSVPMMTNVTLNPVIVSVGNPSGGSLTSGNGAIAGEGRIRPRRIKGDNNANQRVDIGDATVISRLQVGLEEVRFWDVALNDLNGTGDLDNGDIIKSLRTVVGLDPQPGPMGNAKRLSPVLPMEPAPVSTNYSADLVLLDGPAIKVGRPYRVAVRLKAGRGNLTGLSFSLKYPASLELKEKLIGAELPADALPAWNVSRSRAKLAVIRPKAWAAQSGAVATFIFQPTLEATKQAKLPISLEEVEVSDTGEGLSAVPSVWLEIGGGLEFTPQLRVKRTSADALSLEILGPKGLPMALEASDDLSAWSEIQSVSGQGIDAPVFMSLSPNETTNRRFWRVSIK